MDKEIKKIVLRLARTLPREEQPGAGLHCFHYTRLSKRQSLIITKKAKGEVISPRDDSIIIEINYSDTFAKSERLNILEVAIIGLTKIYGELRFIIGAVIALRKFRMQPEIIHVHSSNYLISGVFLKWLYRVPLFLNFGGTELLRAKSIFYYRYMFGLITGGFYVARSMEVELHKYVDQKNMHYTGNGIDHEIFFPSPYEGRQPQIVCVGNLRWQKDYENLVEAFAPLALEFPAWSISIFGEGPLRANIKEAIAKHNLSSCIKLKGMQSQQDISDAMRSASIFVISSKSEGFPKALIEGMASGLAVVATDAGDCGAVLEGITTVVPSGRPSELRQAIRKLIKNPKLRKEIAAKCLDRAKDYSWLNVVTVVDRVYDQYDYEL
jgi:glycosyltransferase involved in cell wall biosynthesis